MACGTERDYRGHVPLYQQVAERLEQQIHQQAFGDGKLPPERELTRQFQVSVITIKQALNLLANKGLVYRRPRQGTFIRQSSLREGPKANQTLRWVQAQDLAHASSVDAAIRDQFEKTHPGWRLEIRQTQTMRQDSIMLEENLGSADVVSMHAGLFNRSLRRGELAELTGHLDGRLPTDDFFTPAREMGMLDGRTWALPRMLNPTALYVNRALFTEAGIEPERAATSWQSLVASLAMLPRQRDGEKLWRFGYFHYHLLYWENFVLQAGGEFFEDGGNRCLLESRAAVEGLELAMATLDEVGDEWRKDLSADSQAFLAQHGARNLACFAGGPLFASFLRESADGWQVLPLPSDGAPVSAGVSYLVGIRRECSHVAAALDLLELICGPFGQDLLGIGGMAMPAHREAAGKYFGNQGNHDLRGFLESVPRLSMVQPWAYQPTAAGVLSQLLPSMLMRREPPAEAGRRTAQALNLLQLPPDELWLPTHEAECTKSEVLI